MLEQPKFKMERLGTPDVDDRARDFGKVRRLKNFKFPRFVLSIKIDRKIAVTNRTFISPLKSVEDCRKSKDRRHELLREFETEKEGEILAFRRAK